MFTYKLFCGRNIPSGGRVTETELEFFIASYVVPRFDGFTVEHCIGYWKGEKEDTVILSFCTDDKEGVTLVAQAYKVCFNQDSVAMQTLPELDFL